MLPGFATAQEKAPASDDPLLTGLRYRLVGPFRGGRSAAVTGVPGKPQLFYFGSTGGGVWRTTDGGSTWENISDGFFGGSIGAVAVSESDPNVIYVGGGEKTVRGNVSHGDGVWKSTDAGKTWKHVGLDDTRHIPRVRIHPKDPDLVYAAALGPPLRAQQGARRLQSTDGGKTWKQVLFVNDEVGAVDLILDPNNPRILYASTWRVKRTPYSLESGGPGSGLWKSTDGGDTWKEITQVAGPAEGHGRHHRRRGLAGELGPRLGDRRGRGRRRLPLRRRRQDLDQDQRRPQPAPARLVLHAHLRRPEERRRGLRRQRRASTSRPTAARRSPRSARRTATTTTCGSTRPSRTRMIVADDGGAQVSYRRRRDLDHLPQPADRPVLPRHDRQRLPLPHLRRPAGQLDGPHPQPRRRRRHRPSATGSRPPAARAATSPSTRRTPTSSTAAPTAAS